MASTLDNIYGNNKAQPTSKPQPVGGGQSSSLDHIFTGSPSAAHDFSGLTQTLDNQAAGPKITKAPIISVPKQPTNFLDSIRQQVESIFKPQPAEKPLPQVSSKAGLVDIGTSPTAATSAQRPLTKTVVNQQQQSVKAAQPIIDTVNKGKAAINTASKTVSKTANQVSDMGLGELKKNQQLYQATKAVLTDFYNNFTFSPVENALVRTGALDKAPKNVFTNLASQEIQQKQAFGKGILQGVARETLNWDDKVKSVLDTQVKNTPKELKNATTIGGIVGQLATYVAPSGVFQGAKFAKLVLPLTFATLGQTSLPSEESGGPEGTQRIQKAIIDLTAGSMLHMLNQPSYLFSLQSAGLKSAELATLTGQVYADARAQGATHEQATAMVKDALIFNGGLIGALALIKGVPLVGEALVRSRVKEGAGEFTPTEVKNIVINSDLEKTQLGKDMLKNALIADAQGKNVKVTMGASKPSVVGRALGVNKESSLGYSIELTDKKDEYFSLPAEERLKTAEEEFNQKAGITETLAEIKTPDEELKAAQSQVRVKENYSTPLEKTSTEELHSEPIKYRDQYLQKHDNIINPDLARQERPEYKGINAFELNNFGVALAKMSYNHLLDTRQGYGNNTVLWTAGGPGSGKSTALNKLPIDERKKFVAIVDTTLSPNSSVKDIGKVLKRGYKAEILYTLTDPFQAWKQVVARALNPESVDHNRVVNEEYFIKAHNEARKNALEAFDKFKGNPDFREVFLQDGKEIPVDTVRNFSYNASDLRRQIYEYTDKFKEEGKISGDLYKGFTTQRIEQNGSGGSTESQKGSTQSPITEQSPKISRTDKRVKELSIVQPEDKNPESSSPKKEAKNKFDYQSTQLDLPKETVKKAVTFVDNIPEEDLAKDPNDNYEAAKTGREKDPHVTVLYGLDNKLTKEQLTKALEGTPPITLTLGKTSLFNQPDKDILKVDVESTDLVSLNKKLQEQLDTPGQTFKEYKPHMTLAYLRKGIGTLYKNDSTFEGDKITLNHLTFSTNTGDMVKIPLKGAAPVVESNKEEPLRPSTNAAVGEFASLPNKTEPTGTDQPYEPTGDGNPTIVPFPEMVRLARALTGAYPKIKEKMAAGVRGRTTEGSMDIKLLARLFKDGEYEQAAKTLSHEIGHVADMLPEGFVTKGNILAKIANIKGYLKTLLKEFPSSEDNILTPEDRANIRKAAEKYAKTPVVETVQEVIGKEPVKPQELLAIWNDITAAYKDPELLSYIQGLTSEQKVDLARNAMKGKVPKWVDFMRSVKETVTKEVLRNSKADIRQVYQKMLKDEILARRLHDLNAIKQQLYKLSKEWRPYIEREADPSFIAYRKSSNELYADAISVLLNDPERLKTSAPDFWRAFFNYLGEKPEVKNEFFQTWDFLRRSDDEVQNARLNDLYEGFAEAKAKRETIELKKPVRPTFIQSFMQQYVSRFDPIYRKLKDATTEAGAQFSPLSTVRMQLEEMQMRRNSSYVYLTNILKDVMKPIEDMGLTAEDLGVLMTLERNLGDRKSIANPYGLQGKFSVDALAFLKKKLGEEKGITDDQFSILEQAARKFREYHFDQILKAGESGLYSQKFLNETAIPNKNTYVTYQVVDYIHKNFVSQAIKHAIGTLNQIENPVVSTILKTISIIEATERQLGVKTTADALREAFPEEYLPAEAMRPKGVFTGWKPAENLVPLEYRDDGKLAAINVDPMIARAFDMKTPQEAHEALRVFSNFNRIFRDVVTTYNLSWGSYSNPLRDASRTYRNLSVLAGTIGNKKGLNIFELPTELAKALPTSIKFQRGQLDAVSRAMLESKAYSTSFVDYDPRASEDTSLAPMLRQYRILPPIEQQHALLHKLLTPIDTLLKGVRLVGGTIETNTKVAGFQILRKRDISLREAGFYTRNYVGTPNVMEGGTLKHISNQIFIFSNILAQDIRSNLELATGPKTRSGYWFLTFLMDVLPALAALAVAAGLAGQQLKSMQDKISEYNMTNFSNIPLGELSNGHTVYWRIPHSDFGRFVHAIVWKVGEAMTQQGTKPQTLPQALASGILPNTTPLMTLANGWLNYIQGNNPYDSFRGRLVVDDTTWKAGGWPAFQKMLSWTSNTAGLSNFQTAPSYNGDLPQEPWLREIPGLNRAIQTSDYGLQEKEQAVTNKVVQQAAQATLDRKAKLQQFSTEAKKTNDPAQRDAIQKQFIQSVLGNGPYDRAQKAQRTRLKTEFDVAVTKGAISTQMDGLINAQTSAAKTALLQEYKKTMSPDEYKSLVVSAKKGKVISPVLLKKLRKAGLY